ncbi:hypothetical protein jaqu_34730 [Jannaschia aquimarina]|uniref:Capsule polysaccharide biosynthesis protein n=2 Tax=Jannaschia aquimarina TaxID=935700 RepID=A0A0D1EH19_9RHOB|nr:hypothetical protein jaqu_34730 [Jannaschia aquimarina]SNS65352.1 hypothetical protein SAMN05421775_101799 [Jannaschia aquimarina]
MNSVERIVFTGDFLRPSIAGLLPTQHENILWLRKAVGVPVEMATGLPQEILHWDHRWQNGSRVDATTISAVYQMMGIRRGIHDWPRLFDAETLPPMLEDLLDRWFLKSFVIGFELPRWLVSFLSRRDVPFVDVSLSPIRFMDDLLFEVSASHEAGTAAIRSHGVPEDLIRLQAGVLASNVAKSFPSPPRPNTLLILLQTRYDKVLIRDGRFVSLLDRLDELERVAAEYDNVLIKAHPLETQEEVIDAISARLDGVRHTTENFYRLVSHDGLRGVAALSSSGVHEASWFGKRGHYLIEGFTRDTFTVGQEGFDVGDAILMPDFWRDVLGSMGLPVTEKDGLRLPSKPNRFRQQLRSAWGFNEVDTDIPASWARTE